MPNGIGPPPAQSDWCDKELRSFLFLLRFLSFLYKRGVPSRHTARSARASVVWFIVRVFSDSVAPARTDTSQ